MPEPVQDKAVDEYSRDVEDPFSTKDEHVTILRKIRFVAVPFLISITIGRAWIGYKITFNSTSEDAYWTILGSSLVQGSDPPFGCMSHLFWIVQARWGGAHPHVLKNRTYLIVMILAQNFVACNVQLYTNGNLWTNEEIGSIHDQPSDDTTRSGVFIQAMLMMGCIWCPLAFKDMSPWGYYCCAKMPQARGAKCLVIQLFFTFFNFFVSRYLSNLNEGIMGSVVKPILLFAWKRIMYFGDISVCTHDSPFKGHCFVMMILSSMCFLNFSIALTAIGVVGYNEATTFIAVDWITFFLRVVVVGRLGMKQCPKLVTYLTVKQMENMPSPLPVQAEAVGAKTAMRCVQAFACLAEGESMTSMYMLMVFNFVLRWAILRDNQMMAVCPMRSFWIITLYLALDFVQDMLADKIANKFNNWSYLYGADGIFHRRMWLLTTWYFAPVGFNSMVYVSEKWKNVVHGVPRFPIPVQWYWSSPSFIHY